MERDTDHTATGVLEPETAETKKTDSETTSAIEALEKLANSNYQVEGESTTKFMSDKLGVDIDASHTLEQRIRTYQKHQSQLIADYNAIGHARKDKPEDTLIVLNGWNTSTASKETSPADDVTQIADTLLSQGCCATTGGLYLRWKGTGVVINPGRNFLKQFHQQGLTVADIDCVVVTRDNTDSYCDIQAIYDLNYQVNASVGNENLHIVHYYLNQKSYRDVSAQLKPNFKQERNTVHCLELFIDSPDVENVTLSDSIALRYFLTSTAKDGLEQTGSCLGCRIDCSDKDTHATTSVGYISGTCWSPMLAHNLGRCDTLVVGFENTNPSDYGKVKYNDDSLGYFGTYSLVEEVKPRVVLCCEFSGREGDIRVEVAKKIRQEYAYSNTEETVILPGDTGLRLDLKELQIQCSLTGKKVDPASVRVVKTTDAFGRLQYLAPSCLV